VKCMVGDARTYIAAHKPSGIVNGKQCCHPARSVWWWQPSLETARCPLKCHLSEPHSGWGVTKTGTMVTLKGSLPNGTTDRNRIKPREFRSQPLQRYDVG